jgi:two-component system, NarL family, sensor kinase
VSNLDRPDRGTLALLLVVTIALSLAAAFVWLHATGPFDGTRLEPGIQPWVDGGLLVTPLYTVDAGLQSGDVVVAAGGRSMESWAQDLFRFGVLRPNWQIGDTVEYTVLRLGQRQTVALTLESYPLGTVAARNWGTIAFALIAQVIATFAFILRRGKEAARVLFLWTSSILSATTWSLGLHVSDVVGATGFWLFKATTLGAYLLFWAAGLHFALVFPRRHPALERRPWLVTAIYLAPYTLYLLYLAVTRLLVPDVLGWLALWTRGEAALAGLYLALTLLTVLRRFRERSDWVTRQKIRWVMLGALLSGGIGLLLWTVPAAFGEPLIDSNVLGLVLLPFPLSIAVAILRYQLFDIDTLLNRALVYGALTAMVLAIYTVVVGLLGLYFRPDSTAPLTLVAAALVAVLFQPLRERLQRGVNHLLYGERDEPYGVLARLGQRLEATLEPEAVLPATVETVAQALRLPYAAISLRAVQEEPAASEEAGDVIAASYGKAREDLEVFPLIYQGDPIGSLMAAPRSWGETFSPADRRLLTDLAQQVSIAAHAVQLSAQLRRSRQRLVTAREEERRRIRRDLHDGLGPTLAGLTLKVDAARNLLDHDPGQAHALLAEVKSQTQHALADIRRLVYGLRPPALDELGLISAIREQAARYQDVTNLCATVEGPESLPPLPAAVEVAAYRIVVEALTNVVRHGQARNCTIRLSLAGELALEIVDDGLGLPPDLRAGVGLTSIRERAAELGGTCVAETMPSGGTRVRVTLPLEQSSST